MTIKLGDAVSSYFHVSSGVPQGSHLGPLIFFVYLNDVNLLLKSFKLSFADDFKLYWIVNNVDDALFLQSQLGIFTNWCETNRMHLNASKCSVMSFSRKRILIDYDYKIRSTSLKRESVIKDLGVLLDPKLTFKEHIDFIASKASKTLGFIFRVAKNFRNIQ